MSFIAVAIGVGAAAGIAGGVMQANAQKDAANKNRQNVKDTNALNYQMYRESRGEGGNAILPLYAPEGSEERFLNQAIALYEQLTGKPQQKLAEYQSDAALMAPVVSEGNQVINDIYSGAMEQQRLADLAPVLQARAEAAQADADAVNLALSQEQNRINAQAAEQGYVGAGSFNQNRLLQAAVGAKQQAARTKAAAALDNAGDVRAVKENQRDLQVRSLDVPVNRAVQLMQLRAAPSNAILADQRAATGALDFFRLNPGNPPQAQPAIQSATPSTGAVVAAGVGQAAGAAGNYIMARNYANTLATNQNANALVQMGGSVPTNYSALSPDMQQQYNTQFYQAHLAAPSSSIYE